jgi:hypothetical protein
MDLSRDSVERVRNIVSASKWLSFGNPELGGAQMTAAECRQRRAKAKIYPADPICGAPNMVAINAPGSRESSRTPTVCIDQYEFPNIACEYPIVWVRSSEAADLCSAVGKRLCDAHEWEGGCAGAVLPVESEYKWNEMPRGIKEGKTRAKRLWMEYRHNREREITWAYGLKVDHTLCATGAVKAPKCNIVDWGTCATLSYPAGAFPDCVSPIGVYDQHGNAAEHMNLPLDPSELSSAGGMGWTEMKGSWFIFARQQSHPDDCRWRAKNWHTSRVDDPRSHRNYHLGFRCCRDAK